MYIYCSNRSFNLAKKNMQNYYTRVPVYGGVPIHGIPIHGIPVHGIPVHRIPVHGIQVHGIPVHGIPNGNVRIVHKKRAVPTGEPPKVTVRHVWG